MPRVNVKLGIVDTECIKLLQTNRFQRDFELQKSFFIEKLCMRGYKHHIVRAKADKFCWHDKVEILTRNTFSSAGGKAVIPFKVQYSHAIKAISISSSLRKYEEMLPADFSGSCRFVACFLSGQGLFELKYARCFKASS